MAKLRITYVKSGIGYAHDQKRTIQALGLRKLNTSVIQNDNPTIRGMIFKVQHLVSVEEVGDDAVIERPAKPARPVVRKANNVETPAATAASTPAALAPTASDAGDDLEIIEGIGPKIASVLRDAGITTFAALAQTEVGQLNEILGRNNLGRIANPGTWPEQAQLAADGKMDELRTLQASLNAGRR